MIKYSSFEFLDWEIGGNRATRRKVAHALGIQRTAAQIHIAHRADFDYDPRPGFLYVRSRAISSRCNDNYDEFPAEEIEKGYRTFIGKPVFVNHVNENHHRARGVIIDAALHKDANPDGSPDTWCEVLMEVDAMKFPKLAEAIVKGHIDKTSMGVDVDYSICSACGNKATNPAEYCRHIPQMKGSKLIRRNASTGKPEEVLIYESCYGLRFFENSLLVEDPADPTAFFLGVDDRGLRMAQKTAAAVDALVHREWYHGGTNPTEWEHGPSHSAVVHVGTEEAAKSRIDPGAWDIDDAMVSGAHIPHVRMWKVRLKPDTKLHPRLHTDDEAGSLGFEPPQGYHGVAYKNDYEDKGKLSLAVHPSQIASAEEMPDPYHRERQEWIRTVKAHPEYEGELDHLGSKTASKPSGGLQAFADLTGGEEDYQPETDREDGLDPGEDDHHTGLRLFASSDEDDDLTSKSPGEIDAALATHHENLHNHIGRQQSAMSSMHHALGDLGRMVSRSRVQYSKTDDEVMNADTEGLKPWKKDEYLRAKSSHTEASNDIDKTSQEISRHESEFRRRGGWSRFFLVPDGHIHSSMACHSCRPTTQFGWLPHLSGKSEEEAVNEHGPHLCTHCFPSAPVEWKQDPAETRAKEKQQSGETCAGGKASKYLSREEINERKAQHPQGKITLGTGEAFYGGQRQGIQGRCPTCNTVQKVKNSGEFYQHKPPPVTMTPPREEEKPKGPPMLEPVTKAHKTHLRSKHNWDTHTFNMVDANNGGSTDWAEVHRKNHAEHSSGYWGHDHEDIPPKTGGLQAFARAGGVDPKVPTPGLSFSADGTWSNVPHTEGTHRIPVEQAKQWIDPGMRDRDKLIAFDGRGYWDNLLHSMKTEGQREPITVRRTSRGNVIWEGNHRVHAADMLGWSHINANFEDATKTAGLIHKDYEGRLAEPRHITRRQDGTIPTSAIAHLRGVKGEVPGEHRNRKGQAWEDFKADIAANGIQHPIFITHDYGEEPKISEGNHRRDAAVELGLPEVPVEIKHFGQAERHDPFEQYHESERTAALDPSHVREIEPEEFHRNFSEATANSPFRHHVTNHTPDEIRSEGMKPLTTNGGRTGVLIHNHGDGRIEATGLYNQSDVPGAGVDLLRHAITHHGVNYVEAYGPKLPRLYRRAGFQTQEKYRFDREQAHPDWDFRSFDSPSYHIMSLRRSKEAIVRAWPSIEAGLSQSPSTSLTTQGLRAFGMSTGVTQTRSPGSGLRSRPRSNGRTPSGLLSTGSSSSTTGTPPWPPWVSPRTPRNPGLMAFAMTVDPELWKQPKPEWDEHHDRYQSLYDQGKNDEASALMAEHTQRKNAWASSMKRAISLGHISPEEAKARGHYHHGDEDPGDEYEQRWERSQGRPGRGWQEMPHTMYHVTTNAPAVREHGLKTREELDQSRGAGLGGGAHDTISFTTDEGIAHDIHRGIHEMRQVARGERTMHHMVEEAKAGTGAQRPFWDDIKNGFGGNRHTEDGTPFGLDQAMRRMTRPRHSSVMNPSKPDEPGDWRPAPGAKVWTHRDTGETLSSDWERPMTHAEKIDHDIEFAKTFSAYREHAGGHFDPLFFSSDAHGLANVPAHHIQILKVHPRPGAKGYPTAGMKEWRTSSGDAVDVEHEPVEPRHHFGAIETPCQTPEVNYNTTINDHEIGVTAEMPMDVDLDAQQADTLDRNLHNMMEMVLAPLFPPAYEPPHKTGLATFAQKDSEITMGGLAVWAADTGRLLMIQRRMDPEDKAAGTWEFPGGHVDKGESPLEAGIREWKEEVGQYLPEGHVVGSWTNAGMYRGYVYVIAHEADVPCYSGKRPVTNPDDPHGDNPEAMAWFEPKHLPKMPALRPECRKTDWSVFNKRNLKKVAASPRPNIGTGWFLHPDGKKENVYYHAESGQGVPFSRMSQGHVRVRSYGRQLYVQAVHPFTDAQHKSLVRSADTHDRVYVDMLHPQTQESIHDESGDATDADRIFRRATNAARQVHEAKKVRKTERPQKCKYCKAPATKSLGWAEGMAYIPVCDDHEAKGRDKIVNGNGDEVCFVHEIRKEAIERNPDSYETLYRGLHFGEGSDEDIERLHKDPQNYLHEMGQHYRGQGIHWTPDYNVAHRFAMGRDADDTYGDYYEEPEGKNHGVVLEAHVHPRHELEPGSQEHEDYSMMGAILGPDSHEHETTLRDGSKVHINKLHAVSEGDEGGYDRVTSQDVRLHRRAGLQAFAGDDHETWYHLTDQHHFDLNPEHSPQDNAFAIQDRSGYKGLYVTKRPEHWFNGQGYKRPYVAEIHAPHGIAQPERWGGEHFIPAEHFDKVKVHRVIPWDAHCREEYGEPGHVETYHGTHYQTDKPLKPSPISSSYYVQDENEPEPKDVRSFTDEEHTRHLKRMRDYLHDVHGWGWNEFNEKHEHVGTPEEDTDDEGMEIRRDKQGNPMTRARYASLQAFADFVPHDDKFNGQTIYSTDVRQPSGSPVRGKGIRHDDPSIPDTLYHVTTNRPAIEQSGRLRAGGVGGLGGDRKDEIVSMTTDHGVARQLAHDIKFMAGMYKKHGEAPEWRTPERAEWGKKVHADFSAEAERHGFKMDEPHPVQLQDYNMRDWANQHYMKRSFDTKLRDPQFFEDLHHVNPDHVGIVHVPKHNLNNGAQLTDLDRGNKYGLEEIRSYGDVPLHGAHWEDVDSHLKTASNRYEPGTLVHLKPGELGTNHIRSNVDDLKAQILKSRKITPISITPAGDIVDGSHRYKALHEIGASSIPAWVGHQLGGSGRLETDYPGIRLDLDLPKTAAKLPAMRPSGEEDDDKVRRWSELATAGGPTTIKGGNSNPQAVAMKKKIHRDLYTDMKSKMESDPELEHWARSQGDIHRPWGPTDHGYEHPTDYEGQEEHHVNLGHQIKKSIDNWAGTASDHDVDSLSMQLALQKHFKLPESTLSHSKKEMGDRWQEVEDKYNEHKPFLHHFVQSVYDNTQKHLARTPEVLLHRGHGTWGDDHMAEDWMRPKVSHVEKITPEARELHNRYANSFERWDPESTHLVHYDQPDPRAKNDYRSLRVGEMGHKNVKVGLNPASSWSTNKAVAAEFADRTYKQDNAAVLSARVPRERVWSTAHTGPGCLGEREMIVLGGTGDQVHLAHNGFWQPHPTDRPQHYRGIIRKQGADETPNIDAGHHADWIKDHESGDAEAGGSTVQPKRTENLQHILHHFAFNDGPDWETVSGNYRWNAPQMRAFEDHIRRHGIQKPIPIDYGQTPPKVLDGHTRLAAAERVGHTTVPVEHHDQFDYEWHHPFEEQKHHLLEDLGHEGKLAAFAAL